MYSWLHFLDSSHDCETCVAPLVDERSFRILSAGSMSEPSIVNRCDECRAVNCENALTGLVGHALDDKQIYESTHELILDTYRAQHSAHAKPLTTFFGLNGLLLALEFGYSGTQVRDAHKRIADRSRVWPVFTRRIDVPATAASVAQAIHERPDSAEATVREWAELVWMAWSVEHERIREETESRFGRRLPLTK
jgi:hypothetical protein